MKLNGSSLLLIIATCCLAKFQLASCATTTTATTTTTQARANPDRQDARNWPSPLPARRNKQAGGMNLVDLVAPAKRRAAGNEPASASGGARTGQKKRFKTSGRFGASSPEVPLAASGSEPALANATRGRELWRSNAAGLGHHDANNNSITTSDDNNNNNNEVAPAPTWRRNVDSINGTIDLSQYERNDIDRLYGDALLVYFKNFNETLPARRELFSINGTLSSAPAGSRNRIPIYRSVSSDEPK